MTTSFRTRMPVMPIADGHVAVLVGTPKVPTGQCITVRDLSSMETHRDMYVTDVLVTTILDMPDDVLDAFQCSNFSEFRMALSTKIHTALPAESFVTIIIMGELNDMEADEVSFEDATDDDDILPLVLPDFDVDVEVDVAVIDIDELE